MRDITELLQQEAPVVEETEQDLNERVLMEDMEMINGWTATQHPFRASAIGYKPWSV